MPTGGLPPADLSPCLDVNGRCAARPGSPALVPPSARARPDGRAGGSNGNLVRPDQMPDECCQETVAFAREDVLVLGDIEDTDIKFLVPRFPPGGAPGKKWHRRTHGVDDRTEGEN